MNRRYCLTLDLKDDPQLIADDKATFGSGDPSLTAAIKAKASPPIRDVNAPAFSRLVIMTTPSSTSVKPCAVRGLRSRFKGCCPGRQRGR